MTNLLLLLETYFYNKVKLTIRKVLIHETKDLRVFKQIA